MPLNTNSKFKVAGKHLDLKTGVTQFADEQTTLGLLTANKIMQKVRSDLLTINGVNTVINVIRWFDEVNY